MRATATSSEIAAFSLRAGDVLITKDSESWDDIAVPAYVPSDLPGVVCAYHLALIRPRQAVMHGAYLHRALEVAEVASPFYVEARGVTRFGLTLGGMKNVLLPVPPKEEQEQIGQFVASLARRTNRLLRAKQRLIALLNEQKQAIIQRAVTRGLDPDVRLKPSGVDWLGEVPAHWGTLRVKYIYTEVDERSETGKETHLSMSQKYGLIPSSELTERAFHSASYVGGKLCDRGDLVLNRLKAHLGVFALARQPGLVSPDYSVRTYAVASLARWGAVRNDRIASRTIRHFASKWLTPSRRRCTSRRR